MPANKEICFSILKFQVPASSIILGNSTQRKYVNLALVLLSRVWYNNCRYMESGQEYNKTRHTKIGSSNSLCCSYYYVSPINHCLLHNIQLYATMYCNCPIVGTGGGPYPIFLSKAFCRERIAASSQLAHIWTAISTSSFGFSLQLAFIQQLRSSFLVMTLERLSTIW